MARLIFFLLLGFFFSLPDLHAEAKPLKVITYNTFLVCIGPKCLFRKGPLVPERMKLIARWLKEQKSDIVFLQEVWKPYQYDYFKKNAGYPYSVYFGQKSDLAILSRHPLSNPKFIPNRWQGSYFEDCQRGVVGYRYGLGRVEMEYEGKKIVLANIHPIPRRQLILGFAAPADSLTPERKIQFLEYWDLLKQDMGERPLILAGDYNMNHTSDEFDFFSKLFRLTSTLIPFSRHECSYCPENKWNRVDGYTGEKIIDHIYVNNQFNVIAGHINHAVPDLSDHQPVETTMEVKELAGRGGPMWPPDREQLGRLTRYIENTQLSPYCYLSPEIGFFQKSSTLKYIKNIIKSVN